MWPVREPAADSNGNRWSPLCLDKLETATLTVLEQAEALFRWVGQHKTERLPGVRRAKMVIRFGRKPRSRDGPMQKTFFRRLPFALVAIAAVMGAVADHATAENGPARSRRNGSPRRQSGCSGRGPGKSRTKPRSRAWRNVIVRYETLHILHASAKIKADARAAIGRDGGNPDHPAIVWHAIASDNAWMRDNGPVYVLEDGRLRVQNWTFDAWGGAFGADVGYRLDDQVPARVAAVAGLPVDTVGIVHERGKPGVQRRRHRPTQLERNRRSAAQRRLYPGTGRSRSQAVLRGLQSGLHRRRFRGADLTSGPH